LATNGITNNDQILYNNKNGHKEAMKKEVLDDVMLKSYMEQKINKYTGKEK
jgi:hypothetical protein